MAAHRRLDQRRDDLCVVGLRKRGQRVNSTHLTSGMRCTVFASGTFTSASGLSPFLTSMIAMSGGSNRNLGDTTVPIAVSTSRKLWSLAENKKAAACHGE